jgi:hypothetical protein
VSLDSSATIWRTVLHFAGVAGNAISLIDSQKVAGRRASIVHCDFLGINSSHLENLFANAPLFLGNPHLVADREFHKILPGTLVRSVWVTEDGRP